MIIQPREVNTIPDDAYGSFQYEDTVLLVQE